MQAITTIQSPPYRIALYPADDDLVADLQDLNTQQHFLKEQIQYGVLGDLPHCDLLVKIKSMETKLAAFPFPKANPTELWLFEAVPMAALAIRQGKEHLREEEYKKALEQFNTALKIQRLQKGETADLERAIGIIQKKKDILKWKQTAPLYLPNEKAIEDFASILGIYEDQDDIYACFQTLIAIEDHLLPHHYLMAAIVHEKQKSWQEAIEAYLQLAEHTPRAMACFQKAYALLEKAQWLDRSNGVRMIFEKMIMCLNTISSSCSPTCFICFDDEEEDVREWLEKSLAPDLELAGIKPLICLQKMRLGQDLSSFHELAKQADFVIIACTPRLKANYEARKKAPVGMAQEIRLIKERYRDPAKASTIFPLILKGTKEESIPTPCFEPISSATFSIDPFAFRYFAHAFDLFAAMRNVPKERARKLCEEFMQDVKPILRGKWDREEIKQWQAAKEQRTQALAAGIIHRVAQLTKRINLPLPPSTFTGRTEDLNNLHAACCQTHRVAITGLGGVGKTALALQYANSYQTHYAFIHFMSAGTAQLVIEGLLKLADDLFVPQSGQIEQRLTYLKTILDRREEDYLLIFDGIDEQQAFEELKKYVPNRGRCLLLTSRLPDESQRLGFKNIELKPLSIRDATAYLLEATSSQEEKHAQALAEKLGMLPLALTHAASYIRRRHIDMQTYHGQFEHFHLALFENKQLNLKLEEKTILTTWNMSVEAIVNKHNCPLAKDILYFLAFLGQAPIPSALINEWFKRTHVESNELELGNALAYLGDYSMITSSSPATYDIHLLVQHVMRNQLDEEMRNHYLAQALQVCQAMVQDRDPTDIQVRQELAFFMPHFKAIANYSFKAEQYPHLLTLLEQIWGFDYHGGYYQDIEQIAQLGLKIGQKREDKVKWLNGLGMSLLKLGKLAPALFPLYEALKLCQQFPEGMLLAIQTLNNNGRAYWALGYHKEALDEYCQALQLSKILLGERDLTVAMTLNNMSGPLEDLGLYQAALECQIKALAIKREILGEKHPSIAKSLGNMGSILGNLNRHEEALQFRLQSLALMKEVLGEKHPNVVTSLNNVGSTLTNLQKHEEALNYHKQALKLKQELLGGGHPQIAVNLNHVGSSLRDLGKYEKALKHHRQALELSKAFLGEKHADVAKSLNHVGLALQGLSNYEEALVYHKRALKIRQELLEERHPDMTIGLNYVGATLGDLGRHEEALKYYQKALKLRQKFLGENHPDVATSFNNVGLTLWKLGRYEEALKHHKQALEIRQEMLGDGNPQVIVSLNHIGLALEGLGNYEEALNYYVQALKMSKDLLGEEHPNVAAIHRNIASVLQKL